MLLLIEQFNENIFCFSCKMLAALLSNFNAQRGVLGFSQEFRFNVNEHH